MKAAAMFSPDTLKNWEKTGKNEFVKLCIKAVKDEDKSVVFDMNGKMCIMVTHINDLILHGIRGTIKKESVVTTLHELVTLHNDVPSIILDILNVADAETLCDATGEQHTKERGNFCYMVKECEKFLSDKLLKERLEIDTLQEVGILKNRNFYTKFIKVKTKLYYKQRKFNLFREESEGFAKLVTELNQTFSKKTTHHVLLDIVQSLIGCFNLDPNRVLDLILESFENKPRDAHLFIPLIRAYMSDPKTICEVLGSKFTQHRNDTVICKDLYILTAQLLQHEIIKLDDIYIWLSPEDKVMQKEFDKDLKDAKEYVRKLQIVSTNNKEREDSVPEEKENPIDKFNANQKLGLCEALLTIGDWENAKLLMARLPDHYAIEQQPIALALCKLLHHIVEPVYRKYWKLTTNRPSTSTTTTPTTPTNTRSHQKLSTSSASISSASSSISLLETNPLAPQPAHTFDALCEHAVPMFHTLGAALRYDTVLLYKLVRIGRVALHMGSGGAEAACVSISSTSHQTGNANSSSPLYHELITLLDRTVLPALSYLECNCSVAEEIWSLVKLYPYQTRYCLYSRWKNDTYSIYPELLRKRGDAEKKIKNIMKRVSKENIKPVGRFIGKLTHSSPGFLFDYVLLQIQVFDNLIHPVVDSLKYLTNLSYDVLGYCLLESLSNADKNRVKHDSTSISSWLQSLSSFCGAVYKKYNIELTGLLQYVANQLKAQKSLDLLILKEIVQKMAGIDSAEDLTIEQLNAMSGGELLKVEAGYFSQVRNTKKSSLRLKEAMADQNLAVALCLLMAQQKYCVVYRETQKSHLKLVGKLSDQCQDTLVQFGTFLGSTFSVDEYVKKLPSIETMLLVYHIPNEVAFFLARPMFNHAITKKYDELRKEDPNYKKMSTANKQQKYYEAVTAIMTPVHASVIPLHPINIWEDISPQLISTFWSLTMYDLHVPEDTYLQAINKIKQQSIAHMDSNSNSSSKSKKEQDRYLTLMEKLQEERRKQQEHVDKVLYRLKQEKDGWFLSRSAKAAKNETITRFLQLCIFPRCTFTAIDAVYCAKFVHTLHVLKTQNFSTLLCYDRLFCDITYSVTSCTENEAMRYGRFLYTMLETIMHWHKSREIFDKECAHYPGFMTKYRVSNHYCNNHDQVNYENFRHVCHKWHYKLAKAMITCLESKDYVQIRNALIVLIRVIPFFPVLIRLAQVIEKKVEKMRDEEKNKRQDLFTLAVSYVGKLKLKISSGQIVSEAAFHDASKSGDKGESSNTSIITKQNGDTKDTIELKETRVKEVLENRKTAKASNSDEAAKSSKIINLDNSYSDKQTGEKEKTSVREESRERQTRRDEKRDESSDRDRDRSDKDKRRDRKEEKQLTKDDRQYREDRFVENIQKSPTEEPLRYSSDRERFFEERGSHYYREVRDEREVGSSNGSGGFSKHNVESEPDRDVKRRKTDNPSTKTYAKQPSTEERKSSSQPQLSQEFVAVTAEKSGEKKERSSKTKEKQREKYTDDEKEQRKEKKLTRKRDRAEETVIQADHKKRRDEDKAMVKLMHPNGELSESPHAREAREKHHHSREKSPYLRERSHDRGELREKHRRSTEGKRR